MTELKERIHDENNGLDYVLVGDYYIPELTLPEENRLIGKWGRMHRYYLKEYRPILFNELVLSCKLNSYLADLNEQAQARYELIVQQMKDQQGIDETLKKEATMAWVGAMNQVGNSAREIVLKELIYC